MKLCLPGTCRRSSNCPLCLLPSYCYQPRITVNSPVHKNSTEQTFLFQDVYCIHANIDQKLLNKLQGSIHYKNRCFMCIQWTRVLYSVVITWYANPLISQFNRPCNEFTSVWSMFPYNAKMNEYIDVWYVQTGSKFKHVYY